MGHEVLQDDWVRRFTTLTAEPDHLLHAHQTDVAASQRAVERLLSLAHALVASGTTCPAPTGCTGSCRLSTRPGGRHACDLLPALAAAAATPTASPVTAHPDAYLLVLSGIASSVWYCRRVAHPSGACWFSGAGPEADLCGRTLLVAHRLGDPGVDA